MTGQVEGQLSLFDLDTWSSKTSLDYSAVMPEKTSRQSSRKSSESSSRTLPMCLCLIRRGGKWSKSGCIYDDLGQWSIAWRLHDGQFWGATQYVDERMHFRGTPQRRKRIALVADFSGLSAPDILFERKGVSAVHGSLQTQCQGLQRHPETSRKEREGTAGDLENSPGESGE